jgi:predicted RNA-binding protein with RPS1 domain
MPALYTIHRGKVHSIREFGVFVAIPGFRKQGLVHLSQVSNYRIENPSDLNSMFTVSAGEEVWVKVIKISDDMEKYSLSIKYVNQRDGTDLDPNHVNATRDSERSKNPGMPRERGAITLDYKYNITCPQCGGTGHLAKECHGDKSH